MRGIDKWSVGRLREPRARVQLYCFPYSGTGGVVYQAWVKALSPEIDVCPIELPGRWTRLSEPPCQSVRELVDAVGPLLAEDAEKPYALFGCSFGGIVAFELCRWMRRHHLPLPVHLFVAATRAPSLKRAAPTMHLLSDTALIRRVAQLYGPLPQEILESPDMRDMVLRVMRADLKCVETYHYEPEAALPVPITAFGGDRDQSVSLDMLDEWRQQSESVVDVRVLDAAHLFLASHEQELLRCIRDKLLNQTPVEGEDRAAHVGSADARAVHDQELTTKNVSEQSKQSIV